MFNSASTCAFIVFKVHFYPYISLHWGFPGSLAVKYLHAIQEPQETRVRSLGLEHPLEKGMATHSRILAWRILWTEKPINKIDNQRTYCIAQGLMLFSVITYNKKDSEMEYV